MQNYVIANCADASTSIMQKLLSRTCIHGVLLSPVYLLFVASHTILMYIENFSVS